MLVRPTAGRLKQGARRTWLAFSARLTLALMIGAPAAREETRATARARMLRAIEDDYRATADTTGLKAPSPIVRRALATVPRERFVPARWADSAYDNRPLPIGAGQTISQPFIVSLMTDLIEPAAGATVLEVGTGSGYQAAILAECGMTVYSIEIVPALAAQARAALDSAGYASVRTRVGDGYRGWPDAAPFDAIVVTAAPDHVPQALVDQLKAGGRLVIPVGPTSWTQELLLVRKQPDGRSVTRRTLAVRFVPLVRER